MKTYKNIIFDFGAVLIDWNPYYVFTPYFGSREKAEWFIKNICTADWNGTVDKGRSIEDANRELIAKHPEWEKEIIMYFDRWIDMVGEEIPGMTDLIAELKSNGYRVLGLSNWARVTFDRVRSRLKFEKMLDGYLISGDAKMLKPDDDIYQEFIRRFNINPEDSLFIDDNKANVEASERNGIKAIQFTDCEALRKELRDMGILLRLS